ncbi:MerR family transcriptional regulator [Paenibacillus sp. P25]|nr:MerR family transcriptional regulator [Paenibacillus sp. P25]
MFKISDFSKLSRVSVKTLRFYDQIGSLKPQHTDEHSGYRYYTADQLYRLHRILAFKDLGFTLEQIGSMLDEVSCAEIQGMLRLKRAELHKKVLEEQARLARIEARVLQIEQEDGSAPLTDPVVKTLEPQHVASVRERVPRAHLGLLLKDIKRYAREQGIASIPFAIRWHDCSASDETADLEVAVALTREAPGGGRVQVGEWPEAPSWLRWCTSVTRTASAGPPPIWLIGSSGTATGFRTRSRAGNYFILRKEKGRRGCTLLSFKCLSSWR